MTMLAVDDIVRIALREQEGDLSAEQQDALVREVATALKHPETIPAFSKDSRPLSLVRFRALLQDTGYPAEVYLPGESDGPVDWTKLRERWVGWAVEIPGEQDWAKHPTSSDLSSSLAGLSLNANHPVVKDKHPLPDRGTEYIGALLKVYDDDFSPSPASSYDVVGIVSAAPIPTPYETDDEEPALSPAIHVVLPPTPLGEGAPRPGAATNARAALLNYLSSAFTPSDEVAAELLLLALLARPAVRPTGLSPLGTLSLNLVRRRSSSRALESRLASLAPATLNLPLTLPLLHGARFRPVSEDGTSLSPGLLQLAPGTLLLLDEDGLGAGGALNERALKNLQALGEALETQSVSYEYPFMDGVRIECSLRAVVTGEGKSLLPVDIVLPVEVGEGGAEADETQLGSFRDYLATHGGQAHAEALSIPEAVAAAVQDGFVEERKGGGSVEDAELRLKRRMKVARLLALSYPEAELTAALWQRTIEIDAEIERRAAEREARRRETKLGSPAKEAAESDDDLVVEPPEGKRAATTTA